MSKAQLKKHLLKLTKEQVIDVVLELYDARKEAKEYYWCPLKLIRQIISYPQYLHTGIADTFLKVIPYFKIASSPAEAIHRFGE